MLAVGTRKTNSPRVLHTVCSFLIFIGGLWGGGLGVRITVAFGNAKPGSRNTVPETKAYDSGSAVFLPASASGRAAISERRMIMSILFFLFLLFFVFFLIIIEVFFFCLVLFLVLRG